MWDVALCVLSDVFLYFSSSVYERPDYVPEISALQGKWRCSRAGHKIGLECILWVGRIMKMGEACCTYGGKEWFLQCLMGKPEGKRLL
jgi:hypothetical protein